MAMLVISALTMVAGHRIMQHRRENDDVSEKLDGDKIANAEALKYRRPILQSKIRHYPIRSGRDYCAGGALFRINTRNSAVMLVIIASQ